MNLIYSFTCPDCGGHRWGTAYGSDPVRAEGHCQECDYTWPRSKDNELFPLLHTDTQNNMRTVTTRKNYDVLCDNCFPLKTEDKGPGVFQATPCSKCGKYCGPGTFMSAHILPTAEARSLAEKEKFLTKTILDAAQELMKLQVNAERTRLLLSRNGELIVEVKKMMPTLPILPESA